MVVKKKIPMRKCLGCNEMKPKKEMLRVVRNPEDIVSIDLKGKASGRGCYVCPNIDCLNKALKGNRIGSALETEVNEDIISLLREHILNNG